MTRRRRKAKVSVAKVTAGFDGQFQAEVASVQDPHEPTNRIAVMVNTANPVARMRRDGRLDEAEVSAAELYLDLASRAQIGGAQAIDYAKPKVDGGKLGQPLSCGVMDAHRQLAEISRVVGMVGTRLLDLIVVQERGPLHCARILYGRQPDGTPREPTQGEERYITLRFREALREIVDHFGLVGRTGKRAPIRTSTDATTGPSTEWAVGRFGDMVPVDKRIRHG